MRASTWPVEAEPTPWSTGGGVLPPLPADASAPTGSSSTQPRITGGGSIAIDTVEMDHATRLLADARSAIASLAARADLLAQGAAAARRVQLDRARDLLRLAEAETGRAADGLRVAALRYGEAEEANERAVRTSAALAGAGRGILTSALWLEGLGVPALVGLHVVPVIGAVLSRIPAELHRYGTIAPQSDPVLIARLRAAITSLDDEIRTPLGLERPRDLVTDDPASLLGTATVSATLGRVLCQRQGDRLRLTRTSAAWASRPGSIAELALRIPDAGTPEGGAPDGQVRIEEYGAAGSRRWIVYSAGTVTFDPVSGGEPFDLGSNLLGVGDETSDSQRAVLAAMRDAGIGEDEPVLFVGHSQGALNAVRLAQHSGYDVAGVVQFGGPTGQITLPASVPVLAVEHDEDLVPALGGMAAIGGAGANRYLIRRSLPDLRPAPDATFPASAFPAHDTRRYAETTRMMEQAGDPRLESLRARWSPFLDGADGNYAVRYEVQRVSGPAGPTRTAAAGSAPRPSR